MIYVMADIHGNLTRFERVMAQINLQQTDRLYVLGDVIDRNPDGIKILLQLMKMSNVTMLMGNHEYMMLDALDEATDGRRELQRRWYFNGGEVTFKAYRSLPERLRTEIRCFLRKLPYELDVEVGGVQYKLVHAYPAAYFETDPAYVTKYRNAEEFSVWHRWKETDPVPEGCTMIFGHTTTDHYQNGLPLRIWRSGRLIDIDCGCAYPFGRLACLRLDDGKVFYSDK